MARPEVDPAGVLRLGHRAFGPGEHAVMVAVEPGTGLEVVRAAVADGADMVAVGGPPGADRAAGGFAAELREAFPGLLIARWAGPSAAEIGGAVIGPPVLVTLPEHDLAASLAVAAVAAWEGTRVFRAGQPGWVRETRRALRMAAAIRGDIAPAYALRGLA